ncbi:MAG: indolepyruvate oxidoreductase subunit beta [Candidatus Methanodesulfokora sp.]|jgi:indolepyruvate ferredoxin oxidoreductase beta subunit|nr:MAG: hypothetical protein C0200_07830 [Candidatus Korarchaeota archaeon]
MDELNVIIAGVGGQGILFMSRVLGHAAVKKGLNFIQTEVHGLSQRYGSIHTEIRIGRDVQSPLILEGTLDLLMALEPLEALRKATYVNQRTIVVMDIHEIPPVTAYIEKARIPDVDEIISDLKALGAKKVFTVRATDIAVELGDPVLANSVILGAASTTGVLPFSKDEIRSSLSDLSPARYREQNLRAFDAGLKEVEER